MKVSSTSAWAALGTSASALLLAGCLATPGGGGQTSALQGNTNDYAVLQDFHDPKLEVGSAVANFVPQQTGLAAFAGGGKDVWEQEFELTKSGLGKVHVRNANATAFGGKDDYKPASYRVSVVSNEARNLRWEVWATENDYQVHASGGLFGGSSTKLTFKKIMGPFNMGDIAKLAYVPTTTQNAWGTLMQPRRPLIVVYSPSEPGKRYTVKLYKAQLD